MAHKHQYLVYYIHLTDKALYDSLALTGSPDTIGAVLAAPDHTAITYSAPKLAKTDPFIAPCETSDWFGTEDHFPTNVDTFDRKSGGWFGIPFLFGDTTTYHWRGMYTYSPPAVPAGVSVPINIAALRWLDGFEVLDPVSGVAGPENAKNGDANTAGGVNFHQASRHVDGSGFAWRQNQALRTHNLTENGGAVAQGSWERFYLRLWRAPAAQTRLWKATANDGSSGFALEIMPSGQIMFGWDNTSVIFTSVGVVAALPIGVWVKLDVRFWFGVVPIPGNQFELWINGVLLASGTLSGTAIALTHASSRIGSGAANTMELDIDDWIGAAHMGSPDGVDFQNGTRVKLLRATGLDAATASYTGDWRWTLLTAQNDAPASLLTSSTNGAVLALATDAADVDALPESLGAVGILTFMQVGTGGTNPGTNEAIASGGLSTGAVAQSVINFDWKRAFKSISGTPTPVKPIAPVVLKHVKGNAIAETIRTFMATVALIGTFGPEDVGPLTPAPAVLPANTGPHNAPYPRTPWARLTTAPIQPVFIRCGTYVGNGTGQDLLFPMPIHFFHARPSSAAPGGGTNWWSSMVTSHLGATNGFNAVGVVQALMDSAFVPVGLDGQQIQSILRIVGNAAESNAAGVTYTYIAVGDPGQRYMTNGSVRDVTTPNVADVSTALLGPTFTPEAAFVQGEVGLSATLGAFFKGKGSTIAAIAGMAAQGETAVGATFGAGVITTKSALAALGTMGPCPAFSAWRTDDGSSDDVGSNRGKVVQIITYTGDGNASRTIALLPAVGKRPLWAVIVPHNATACYYRDAVHLLPNGASRWDTGGYIATAITGGGIDTISVGITLNAAGVVYDVLAIPGSAVAGNDGFSVLGDFWPVPPDPPPGAPGPANGPEPGDPPPTDPTPPVTIPDPPAPTGPMPGLADDLAAACLPATLELINTALTRIGISKQVVNALTDVTPEATQIRLLYGRAIQETLRDFAWPFATRYAKLTQVSVSRPNSDWLYSYRQPSDCIFERRLVVSRTDVADAAPVPFACSSDFDPGDALAVPPIAATGGGLIFTNLANAVLEYTARPKCPHTVGEPLFREAAAWKLAELVSPALTRIADATVNCAKGYADAIGRAQLVIRPGNAGEVPAASVLDTTATQLAANVNVINLALVRIGARTIRDLSADQSREAQVARIVFEQELRAVLRDFPWSFATQYAALTLVGGSSATPVNADWQYSYRLPTDVVMVRRLVDASRRTYERQPPEFRTAIDGTGALLYTDEAITTSVPVTVEYTSRPAGAVLIADALFRDALAWRLAWTMAPSLAVKVPEEPESFGRGPEDGKNPRERPATGSQLRARAADTAQRNYYRAISTAEKQAANEGQPDLDNPDADWIAGR